MSICGHLSFKLASGKAPRRVETGPAVVFVILTAYPSSLVSTVGLTLFNAMQSKYSLKMNRLQALNKNIPNEGKVDSVCFISPQYV